MTLPYSFCLFSIQSRVNVATRQPLILASHLSRALQYPLFLSYMEFAMKAMVLLVLLAAWTFGPPGHAQPLTQKLYILSNLDRSFLQEFIVPKIMNSLEQILGNTYKCQNVQIHAAVAGRGADSEVFFNLRANCPPSVRNLIIGIRGFRNAPQIQGRTALQGFQPAQITKNSIGINIVMTQQSGLKNQHPIPLW